MNLLDEIKEKSKKDFFKPDYSKQNDSSENTI